MLNFFKNSPNNSLKEIVNKLDNKGVTFIDVRTPEEYATGHAKGAINLPLQTLNDKEANNLKKYESVYVICQSGGRSSQATTFLLTQGVKAINVPGGTSAWKAEGLPMA